ncbi:hypothetical protein PFISCL1PPCAC_7887, partial [Pristionchus fissidentatus]
TMQSYLSIPIEDLSLEFKWTLYFIHLTEFFLILLSIFLMLLSMKILLNLAVFHKHLSVMFCIAFFVYILSTMGRFVLILFELHLIDPDGGIDDWLLVGSSFLRLYGIFYLIFGLLGFTCERGCATYWCDDYERRTSWYFLFLLFVRWWIGGFVLTSPYFSDIITWLTLIISAGSINVVGLVSFILLYRFNCRKWETMRSFEYLRKCSLDGYELSKRFQLVENIRVSRLLHKMAVPLFVNYLLIAGFYFSHITCVIPYISHISLSLYDLWIAIFASSVHILGFVLEPSWRSVVRRELRGSRIGIYAPPKR